MQKPQPPIFLPVPGGKQRMNNINLFPQDKSSRYSSNKFSQEKNYMVSNLPLAVKQSDSCEKAGQKQNGPAQQTRQKLQQNGKHSRKEINSPVLQEEQVQRSLYLQVPTQQFEKSFPGNHDAKRYYSYHIGLEEQIVQELNQDQMHEMYASAIDDERTTEVHQFNSTPQQSFNSEEEQDNFNIGNHLYHLYHLQQDSILSISSRLSVPNCSIAQNSEKSKKMRTNSLDLVQEVIIIKWPLGKLRSRSESYDDRYNLDFRQVVEKLVLLLTQN